MKSTITTTLVIALSVLSSGRFVTSAVADDYKPELFKSVKLIYAENFDSEGPLDVGKQWVPQPMRPRRQPKRLPTRQLPKPRRPQTPKWQPTMQPSSRLLDSRQPRQSKLKLTSRRLR